MKHLRLLFLCLFGIQICVAVQAQQVQAQQVQAQQVQAQQVQAQQVQAQQVQAQQNQEIRVSYDRDIRPILSNHCFACHGPDENARQAGLRLDVRDEAIDYQAIVAGEPDESSIVDRVTSDDPDTLMPPPDSGKGKLTAEQFALIRKWIQQGANYETHWAFVVPERPVIRLGKSARMTEGQSKLADLDLEFGGNNLIDYFISMRLFGSGLPPSTQAEKHTLARRAALTLTGLPPTIEQLERFLNDETVDAYEQYVDRRLASPAYGERMASVWMDIARYSDTDGFQADEPRTNWPWRDWVTDAYNQNMPFDQFTIEQFAGDLLPNATANQILATCFHRNHMTNGEGGRDPAKSRVDYVLDRVNTMGTAWLG